jgi:putative DNA methylase
VSTVKRKLIEVALPLEAINRESAREKSIRHGHPSTLHLWWARRPLAAARAVLFAQLVDDPSARPEEFPTEEEQVAERKRLFALIEKLVIWDNVNDEALYRQVHEEILKSTDGKPPAILDPFAGGGSIPLEAQRLGLEAHASDLNPVAVLINKALIEIPPKWAGQSPVFPQVADSRLGAWPRATGLAEDVRRYGEWIRDEAEKRIGHIYPRATLSDGTLTNVVAWIWARTVTCPNPACGIAMPLARSFWLSKNKDRPTWAVPIVHGSALRFEIRTGDAGPLMEGSVGRTGATCVGCQTPVPLKYIREHGQSEGLGAQLLAVVAEGNRQRVYLEATPDQVAGASVHRPDVVPDALLPLNPRDFKTPNYGLRTFADLFTNRQLVTLTTFSDLIVEVHDLIAGDAARSGLSEEASALYADAVVLYLSFALSKMADRGSSICSWVLQRDSIRNTFARQAIPMTWDYAEMNMLLAGAGSFVGAVEWTVESLEGISSWEVLPGHVRQADAAAVPTGGLVVATDPPYYDNIGYADLSDFFYVWLRRSIGGFYPDVTATMLTPKSAELVATPYRFGGSKAKAEQHFEDGFVQTFSRIRKNHPVGIPVTIFYAFKQTEESEAGTSSTGWETMLNGLIEAGLTITATWPMRTERPDRSVGIGTNALASSIVLACRPREETAEAVTRRGFISALKDELPAALRELQQGSIAPVDLAQAAIGPGIAVFSRHAKVVEADGSDMTVRTALALINQVLDEVLTEQEGDFDADTRFCVKWFSQFGWGEASSGEADVLARATNTSVDGLARGGVFKAVAGKARLLGPDDFASDWDVLADDRVSDWEVVVRLAKALSEQGVDSAARVMAAAGQRRDLDTVKELAYLLFSLSGKRGWTQTAILFNGLGTAWNDLEATARSGAGVPTAAQASLAFDDAN